MSTMPRVAALTFVVLSAMFVETAFAGPLIYTSWNKTTLPLEQCRSRAREMISQMGFGGIQVMSHSVFGERGSYALSVRCATDLEAVFFIAAGPDANTCNRHATYMQENF